MTRRPLTKDIISLMRDKKPISSKRLAAMLNRKTIQVHTWICHNQERYQIAKMREGKEVWYTMHKPPTDMLPPEPVKNPCGEIEISPQGFFRIAEPKHRAEPNPEWLTDDLKIRLSHAVVNMLVEGINEYPVFMTEYDAVNEAARRIGVGRHISAPAVRALKPSIKDEFIRQQHVMLSGNVKHQPSPSISAIPAQELLSELGRRIDTMTIISAVESVVAPTPEPTVKVMPVVNQPHILVTGVLNRQIVEITNKLAHQLNNGAIRITYRPSDRKSSALDVPPTVTHILMRKTMCHPVYWTAKDTGITS